MGLHDAHKRYLGNFRDKEVFGQRNIRYHLARYRAAKLAVRKRQDAWNILNHFCNQYCRKFDMESTYNAQLNRLRDRRVRAEVARDTSRAVLERNFYDVDTCTCDMPSQFARGKGIPQWKFEAYRSNGVEFRPYRGQFRTGGQRNFRYYLAKYRAAIVVVGNRVRDFELAWHHWEKNRAADMNDALQYGGFLWRLEKRANDALIARSKARQVLERGFFEVDTCTCGVDGVMELGGGRTLAVRGMITTVRHPGFAAYHHCLPEPVGNMFAELPIN